MCIRDSLGGGLPTKLAAPPAPVTITLEPGAAVTLGLPGFAGDGS